MDRAADTAACNDFLSSPPPTGLRLRKIRDRLGLTVLRRNIRRHKSADFLLIWCLFYTKAAADCYLIFYFSPSLFSFFALGAPKVGRVVFGRGTLVLTEWQVKTNTSKPPRRRRRHVSELIKRVVFLSSAGGRIQGRVDVIRRRRGLAVS